MTLKQEQIATGICELFRRTKDADIFRSKIFPNGMEPMKIYFRAICPA